MCLMPKISCALIYIISYVFSLIPLILGVYEFSRRSIDLEVFTFLAGLSLAFVQIILTIQSNHKTELSKKQRTAFQIALKNPTARAVLLFLARHNGVQIGTICNRTQKSRTRIATLIKSLRSQGIVMSRVEQQAPGRIVEFFYLPSDLRELLVSL